MKKKMGKISTLFQGKFLVPATVLAGAVASHADTINWSTIGTNAESSFNSIIATVGPIAVGVVIAVAGVRVFIKLINRGAGK